MNIDNPEMGSIDAAAQHLLNKSAPTTEEPEAEAEPEEDNPAEVEETEDVEAVTEPEGEETETDDEETEEPVKFTVKINGKDEEVTLEELQAGYMKDRDYREKTTKVSEERKAVEAEKARVADLAQRREEFLTESQTLQNLIQSFIVPEQAMQDMLKANDTAGYLQAKSHNEKIQGQIAALKSRDEQVQNQITEEQKQALEAKRVAEQERLFTVFPNLKDDANQKALGQYILSQGFAPEDVQNTLDHRLFVAMEKARLYDAIQANAKQKPKAHVPKVTKGEVARKGTGDVKVEKLRELATKAKRSNDINDIAAFIMAKNSK